MYNWNQLKPFVDKVQKEASEAAQAVYDKYREEMERRIRNQMFKGHEMTNVMGACFVSEIDGPIRHDLSDNKFFHEVAYATQYQKPDATFYIDNGLRKEK